MDEFVCGVNYWPRETGVHMWKEWNASSIEAEFREMAALSLNACRVFLLWEDFQPAPSGAVPEAMSKFDELVEIARRERVRLIPTFFTGHMSGENWDIPWRCARDPYADPGMLRAQAKLVRAFARRYRDDDAILFWDLANEPDVFARPTSVDAAWLWTHLLYREIKAFDAVHPVTLGIHVSSLLAPGPFRVPDVAEANDFLCMHPYPMYTELCPEPLDSLRSSYFVPFACRLTEGLGGMKVLLEEFGATTQMTSEDVEARFFSCALYSALANGVIGALAWCFGDFKKQNRPPYDSTPYEVGFGITAADGRVKKAGEVLAGFARAVREAKIWELSPSPARAAIVIPRNYYDSPDPENTPARNAAVLFSSFILAKRAGLDVDFIAVERLESEIRRYNAVFVPCATRRGTLNVSDFDILREYVRSGGTLYCSYDGLAIDGMGELFGVAIVHSSVPSSPTWDILVPGKGYSVARGFPQRVPGFLGRKHLNVEGGGAPGRPAVNVYGQGRAVFLALPLELYLAYSPYVFERGAHHEIYSHVAMMAGPRDTWAAANPAVEVRKYESPDRTALVIVSHEPVLQTVDIAVARNEGRGAWSWRRNASIEPKDGKLALTLEPLEGDIIEMPQ